MGKRSTCAAVLAAVAVLVTACGGAGKPVDPAPVGVVSGPQPANVGGAEDNAKSAAPNDCNATASLAPAGGTAIPAGSTMDKIRQRGKLIVGVDQTTFLFGFRNPTTGNLEGFDIDMANQIAKVLFGTADGHVQYKAITSSQRETVLQNKQVDVVVRTYTVNCARLQKVNFSSVYYIAGQRVLVNNSSKVTGLRDLGGQRVCATKSSTSLAKIAQAPSKPIPVSVDNWSDCLVMLQQGQVAAVSTDDVILAGMAAQDPTTKIVGDRFTEEPYGIGVPKENEDMVRFVNAVLEGVRNGPWQESYNKWVAPRLGQAAPPAAGYK
jgi:polar amino acid transport system substrate-binding protein